jgi:hypothetical protein
MCDIRKVVPVQFMNIYVGMEVNRHLLFVSAMWDDEWSASRPILCFEKKML